MFCLKPFFDSLFKRGSKELEKNTPDYIAKEKIGNSWYDITRLDKDSEWIIKWIEDVSNHTISIK
tara:strand:- start:63 stop:257 length:195 start_codon:yes stop_codon:yes gene_type:complete